MSPTSPKKSNKTDESLSSSSETTIKTSSKKDNWVSHLRGLFTSSESSNVTSPKIGKPPSPALQNNTLRRSEDQKETVMGATLDIEIDSPTTTEGTDSDLPSPRTMSSLLAGLHLDSPIIMSPLSIDEETPISIISPIPKEKKEEAHHGPLNLQDLPRIPAAPRLKSIQGLAASNDSLDKSVETDPSILEEYLHSFKGSIGSLREFSGSYIEKKNMLRSGSDVLPDGKSGFASESSVGSMGSSMITTTSNDSQDPETLFLKRVTSPEPIHHLPKSASPKNKSISPVKSPRNLVDLSENVLPSTIKSRQIKRSERRARFTNFTCLLDAALEGELQEVKQLIEFEQVHPDSCNADGVTALHCAAGMGLLTMAEYLLKHDANVNVADDHGWTPLHSASYMNNMEMIRLFLRYHADVEAADMDGQTPVMLATDLDIIKILSDHLKCKNTSEYVIALYDFDKENVDDAEGDELSFKKGDHLRILERSSNDWWKAERQNRIGFIPRQYVQ